MSKTPSPPMNPYLAGALCGLLIIASVFITGKYFGASTTFVRSIGLIEGAVAPDHVAQNAYFAKEKPLIDWQWMFVLGIFGGAVGASLATGTHRITWVPTMWEARFGPNRGVRAAVAFVGGAVAMFGARLADG